MIEQTREIIPFYFEEQLFRAILIEGEPWFFVSDVCKILELGNVTRVVERLDRDGLSQSKVIDTLGREQYTAIANEPNLYRLIFRSDKPQAKAFQDRVYNEVLPSIRKTGKYVASGSASQIDASQQIDLSALADLIVEKLLAKTQSTKVSKKTKLLASPKERDIAGGILLHIPLLNAKEKPNGLATHRNLARYLKSSSPAEIRACERQLLQEGKIIRLRSGKAVYFEIAQNA